MDLKKALETAKGLALEAGRAIMEIYLSDDIGLEHKDDIRKSELTKADKAADKIISDGLKEAFPEIPVLSEEQKDDLRRLGSEYVWIVDPLDGTKEFVKKNGEFTVNIGLAKDGKPILGVIFIPAKDELYYAHKKAFYESLGTKMQVKVSSRDVSQMVLIRSRSHLREKDHEIAEEFKTIITSGSSLKGCLVARGIADVYFRFGPTSEWDICAMNAIINSAGGKMTDLLGDEIGYNKEDIKIDGFLASNKVIHDKLLEMAR